MNEPFIPAVKAGMAAVGFPVGGPRPPFAALGQAATSRIARLAQELQMSTPTTTETASVRRAQSTLQGADLPPGQHFIAGAFRPGGSGSSIDVIDPSSERAIASVAEGTAEDTDAAVAAAVAAAPAWAALTPKERSEVLHRVADRVAENADLLARLESANTGKPSAVAQDDVAQTVDTFRFMAGALRGADLRGGGPLRRGPPSVILREPLGVIGVMTPWNYPLLMAAWKMAPILAAGNSLVIKPSEQTPLSTLKFAELVAGHPPGRHRQRRDGQGRTVGAAARRAPRRRPRRA